MLIIACGFNSTLSAKSKSHHHRYTRAHVSSSSHSVQGTTELIAEINQAVQSVNADAAVGVQVKSMKRGDELYTLNEDRPLMPGSTLKIFTAEAALLFLGSDYKFSTRVLTDAKSITNGVLDGNIYLVHSGDPSLTYYDLSDLMVALKSQQIQGVNGNVFVDTSAYDQDNTGPGWLGDDTRFCYAAPISASIINHNCISFEIAPAKIAGRAALIVQSPRYFYSQIENSVITRPAGTRSCYVSLHAGTDNVISVSGCIPKGRYGRGASVVISNIIQYNKSLLRSLFNQSGIQINGSVDARSAPSNLSSLAIHDSKPLHVLINQMLKKSDNIIAGSVFKKIGELYTRQPGSWVNGGNAIKRILAEKASVDTSKMILMDGSGLSLNNRVTPAQMMQLLDFSFHNYTTNYEFISSLPIAGVDGTLKSRLGQVAWKVRAKTGTLAKTGVTALAGYAISKDKEPIAFVILVNTTRGNVWKYREMEDKIVTALTNYSR